MIFYSAFVEFQDSYFAGNICQDCLDEIKNKVELISANKIIEPTLYKELICEYCGKTEKVTIYQNRD